MKELKKQWKQGQFHKCYLFYGTEPYLVKNYVETLEKAVLPKGTEGMNAQVLEGKRITAAAIMDAVETLPFFHDKRLVVVKNSGFFCKGTAKEEGEHLLHFMENLPETTCLVFIEEKVEKNIRLYKAVGKYGQVVELNALSEKEMLTWMKKCCAKEGIILSDGTALHLLRMTDNRMDNLEQELFKLIAYKEEAGTITNEDVDAVCSVSLEAKVFDLVRAVAEKQAERAIQLYRKLLLQKESPYMVLSLMARQFRLILESALLSQNGLTNSEIAKKLEIRDFAVRDYLKQSRNFQKEHLEIALSACLQTDLDIKQGKIEEELAVEILLVRYSNR